MRKPYSTKDETIAWISQETQRELSGREIPAFSGYLEVIARIARAIQTTTTVSTHVLCKFA